MITEKIISEIESKIFPSQLVRLLTEERKKIPITKDLARYKQIEVEYWQLVKELNKRFNVEVAGTKFEKETLKLIKGITKIDIIQSFWIANHCLDLFIPSLGYAIELDGSIHMKEHKMRKDELRDKNLSSIGINVMALDNDDIEKLTIWFLFHFKKRAKKTTYQKRQMWRDIYIITLLTHKPSFKSQMEVSNEQ